MQLVGFENLAHDNFAEMDSQIENIEGFWDGTKSNRVNYYYSHFAIFVLCVILKILNSASSTFTTH